MTNHIHKYGAYYGADHSIHMTELPYSYEPAYEYWKCMSFVGAI